MTETMRMILELLANTAAQAESLLHSVEQAVGGNGLYMLIKQDTCVFKQKGSISSLSGKPLKLVDQFTYPGSNISSTENNANLRLAKAWTAIDKLLIIWKTDLSEKIKRLFLPRHSCDYTTTWMQTKRIEKKMETTQCWALFYKSWKQPHPKKKTAVRSLATHHTNHSNKNFEW